MINHSNHLIQSASLVSNCLCDFRTNPAKKWSIMALTLLTLSVIACGPLATDSGDDNNEIKRAEAIGSCDTKSTGTCLNYIKLPNNTTIEELKSLCDEDRTWSDKGCVLNDNFGSCKVEYQGGELTTYFRPPALLTGSKSLCSDQNGTWADTTE